MLRFVMQFVVFLVLVSFFPQSSNLAQAAGNPWDEQVSVDGLDGAEINSSPEIDDDTGSTTPYGGGYLPNGNANYSTSSSSTNALPSWYEQTQNPGNYSNSGSSSNSSSSGSLSWDWVDSGQPNTRIEDDDDAEKVLQRLVPVESKTMTKVEEYRSLVTAKEAYDLVVEETGERNATMNEHETFSQTEIERRDQERFDMENQSLQARDAEIRDRNADLVAQEELEREQGELRMQGMINSAADRVGTAAGAASITP